MDHSPIYFISMDMAEDGSLWAVGDHSVNEDEWNPQLMHFPKEGSAQIFDKLSLESGEQPCQPDSTAPRLTFMPQSISLP